MLIVKVLFLDWCLIPLLFILSDYIQQIIYILFRIWYTVWMTRWWRRKMIVQSWCPLTPHLLLLRGKYPSLSSQATSVSNRCKLFPHILPRKLPGTYSAPLVILTIHTCSSMQRLNCQSQNKIEGKVVIVPGRTTLMVHGGQRALFLLIRSFINAWNMQDEKCFV